MESQQFREILKQIARRHNTTVEEVRHQMQLPMEEAQKCRDPAVRAQWDAIPRKGAELTLEEFVAFVACRISRGN